MSWSSPNREKKNGKKKKKVHKASDQGDFQHFPGKSSSFGAMERENSLTNEKGYYRLSYGALEYIHLLSPCC